MLFFLHSPGLRLRVGADCLHCIAGNYVCCKKSKGCYTDKSYDHCHFFILLSIFIFVLFYYCLIIPGILFTGNAIICVYIRPP